MTTMRKCRLCNAPLPNDREHICSPKPTPKPRVTAKSKPGPSLSVLKQRMRERPLRKGVRNVLLPGENFRDYMDRINQKQKSGGRQ